MGKNTDELRKRREERERKEREEREREERNRRPQPDTGKDDRRPRKK